MVVTTAPQLTWTNIVATIAVMCVMAGGGYKIVASEMEFQKELLESSDDNLRRQIDQNKHDIELLRAEYLSLREHIAYQREQTTLNDSFKNRLLVLETGQKDLIAHTAHTPVEAKELEIMRDSIDKRFEGAQQQINDINRQIAASILLPDRQIPNQRNVIP